MKFCTSCGTQLSDEAQFCSVCGKKTEQPQAQAGDAGENGQTQAQAVGAGENRQTPPAPNNRTVKKGPGGAVFLLLGFAAAAAVMAVLFVTGILKLDLGGPAPRLEGEGYDSPEEAVIAYAEYLKEDDLEGMLSTFAIESYIENFDMQAYYETALIFQWSDAHTLGMAFPNDDGFAKEINLEMCRSSILKIIYYQHMKRLLPGTEFEEALERAGWTVASPLSSDREQMKEQADKFVRTIRRDSSFSDMKIGKTLHAEDMLSEDDLERYFKILDRDNTFRGADELQDICLELTIDGEDYRLFFQTGRYQGKWYNLNSSSTLALLSRESMVPFHGGLYLAD